MHLAQCHSDLNQWTHAHEQLYEARQHAETLAAQTANTDPAVLRTIAAKIIETTVLEQRSNEDFASAAETAMQLTGLEGGVSGKQFYVAAKIFAATASRSGDNGTTTKWTNACLKSLRRAVENGFADVEALSIEPDFNVLKDDKEFREILKSITASESTR